MELYASGFNAWGQLCFDRDSESGSGHADDLHKFTRVFRDDATIEQVFSSLSHTMVTSKGAARVAGYVPLAHRNLHEQDAQTYYTLAEASNGSVALIDRSGRVCGFPSVRDAQNSSRQQAFPELSACKQVVAFDTGFAALTTAGSVYTWGDERYGSCLGRDIADSSPTDRPGLVIALEDLPTGPVSKIAAGGYVLAALTAGNDLYLWGGHPGRKIYPSSITEEPEPIVIEEQDIADVAVGESHLIVLTMDGRVFVIGENNNGQLGLSAEFADSWTPVELGLEPDKRAVGIAAGPRNSFVIVKRTV